MLSQQYGSDVDVSEDGSFIAVGSREAKKVHVYNFNGSSGVYDKLPVITGTGSHFGSGVALSGDGFTLAASSTAGYVNIFKYDGTKFVERPEGDDTTISEATSGWAYNIDLSSDGSTLAVGSSVSGTGTAEIWNVAGEVSPSCKDISMFDSCSKFL